MGNLLRDAVDWLGGVMTSHASELVTYERGSYRVTLKATRGNSEIDVIGAYGIIERSESDDWSFDTAALTLGNVGRTTPAKGDKIRWVDNGTTHVFEVMPFGASPETWRYEDEYRDRIRVHTKHTGTE